MRDALRAVWDAIAATALCARDGYRITIDAIEHHPRLALWLGVAVVIGALVF